LQTERDKIVNQDPQRYDLIRVRPACMPRKKNEKATKVNTEMRKRKNAKPYTINRILFHAHTLYFSDENRKLFGRY